VKVWPAIVAVPVRAAPVLLMLALSVTVPLPVPDWPEAIPSHPVLLAAVQPHPAPALTKTVVLV
jgi:hypothetical protein